MLRASASWLASTGRCSLLTLSGATALQLVSNAAAAAIATAVLGPGERGVMVLGLTIGSFVAVSSTLGTGTSLRARLPRSEKRETSRNLVCAFTWVSICSIVFAALLASAVCALYGLFFDPAVGDGLVLAATSAFTAGRVVMLQAAEAWFAVGSFRRGGSAGALICAGGLLGLLVSLNSANAGSLLFGQALGQLILVLVVIEQLRRAGLIVLSGGHLRVALSLIRDGVPALGMTVGLAFALRADRFVLGVTAGSAAVGVYSLAATISETVRLIPQAIGQVFMYDAAKDPGRRRLFTQCTSAGAVSVPAAVAMSLVSIFVIVPLYGPAYAEASLLIVPLAIAEVAFAPYLVASRGLLGRGCTTTAAMIGVFASGLALVAYVAAAELGDAQGLAVGCIVVYAALSAATVGAYWWRSPRCGAHRRD